MSHTGWLVHALRADESIVVLRADKGNTSVILDTEDYHEKMEELLKDKKFKVLCKDLIRREECVEISCWKLQFGLNVLKDPEGADIKVVLSSQTMWITHDRLLFCPDC